MCAEKLRGPADWDRPNRWPARRPDQWDLTSSEHVLPNIVPSQWQGCAQDRYEFVASLNCKLGAEIALPGRRPSGHNPQSAGVLSLRLNPWVLFTQPV